jgi:hypothetical protein
MTEVFEFVVEHIANLLDCRQSTTTFYFSVNTAILAVIGLLAKDSGLRGIWLSYSILVLLIAGFIACWIWRSLLRQYEILLDWWYARLRELETEMPDIPNLITREYQDLYLAAKDKKPHERIGMTQREIALNWIFTGLYAVFAVGILVNLLI